jgi:hypothetical protein
MAGAFAFSTLWFGLLGSTQQLDATQVSHVLIGWSVDGTRWELGPFFFVMHSTFLPTLGYLSIVAACWAAKVFLIPVHWFLGKGMQDSAPLELTAAFLGVATALFTAGAFMAHLLDPS